MAEPDRNWAARCRIDLASWPDAEAIRSGGRPAAARETCGAAAALPQPELAMGADRLPEIEHIVILMMENHSYDNYLGLLAGRGDGLPLDGHGVPTPSNTAADGTAVPMRHFAGTRQLKRNPDAELECQPHPVGGGFLRRFCAKHRADPPRAGRFGGDDLLDRGRSALLLRARACFPAGDAMVFLLPRPDIPEQAIPYRWHRERAHRRPALRHDRLPRHGHHFRPPHGARHHLGELPSPVAHPDRLAAPVAHLGAELPPGSAAPYSPASSLS